MSLSDLGGAGREIALPVSRPCLTSTSSVDPGAVSQSITLMAYSRHKVFPVF